MPEVGVKLTARDARTWEWLLSQRYRKARCDGLAGLISKAVWEIVRAQARQEMRTLEGMVDRGARRGKCVGR